MLNIPMYHKLIVGCSVIATASIGGFVHSASATEQFGTKNSQSNPGTMLIAQNVSNGGGGNVSNGGGGNVSNGGGGNVSNGGGGNVSNGGGGNVFSNGGGGGIFSNGGGIFSNGGGSNGKSGFSSTQAAISKNLGTRISIADGKYAQALAALAAAEAAQNNASSRTSPVRYGREVADASTCSCLNTDTASAGSLSPEMVAAKAAEADAAAELAAAKAEARTFLESVKSESNGSGANLIIW